MNKKINSIIESEDAESFNNHKFSGKTTELMLKLHHMAAREDSAYRVQGGRYQISSDFMELLLEYREMVHEDLKPLVEDILKTNVVI